MADWFNATEGVKVVKDSASLWPQIITAVSSAGAAFGGVWYGQWRITKREKEAAAEKQEIERLFISTELVFLLEEFAVRCATIATDGASENRYSLSGADVDLPEIDLSEVKGDWRVLPARLMYRIRELPVPSSPLTEQSQLAATGLLPILRILLLPADMNTPDSV